MKFAPALKGLFPPRLWVCALLAAVAFLAIDTVVHLRTTRDLSANHSTSHPLPDRFSPSGLADNQHELVLPYTGIDTYHWVMQTQAMLAGQGARIRSVDYDNAPEGREVHWSSLMRWWLAALAVMDHVYTATPLPQAVEEVAPIGSVLMILLLLVIITPIFAQRFGSVPAALLAFGILATGPLYESYLEGRTDHHGIVALIGLLTVLCLVGGAAGWVRDEGDEADESILGIWLPERPQARRWFIASGIVGGIGLWISAASVVPMLACTGLGALLATGWLGRGVGGQESARPDPSLWRVWGWSGAATSIFFYLLEYFPSHFGLRLEVNHPLYALAWGGGGEIIFRVCRWWGGGKLAERPADWAWLGGGVLAVACGPVLIWLYAGQVFRVSDPFLWTMHMDYIEEFFGLGRFLASQINSQEYLNFLIMGNPLVLLAAFMLAWCGLRPGAARIAAFVVSALAFAACGAIWPDFRSGWFWAVFALAMTILLAGLWGSWAPFPPPLRALLLLTLPPALISFVQALSQVRWVETSAGLWLAALVTVALALQLHPKFRWTWPRLAAAASLLLWALLPNPAGMVKTWIAGNWKGGVSQIEQLELITRDVAQRLRDRIGDGPAVVVSGPTSSTWLIYYGGLHGLGTYYWENLAGMRASAEIYGARTPEQALKIMQEHHVTHLVVLSWMDSPAEYARLARGLRADQPPPADAFVTQLINGKIFPAWIRPIDYQLPRVDEFKNMFVFVAEIVPGQTAALAQVRLAQWQLLLNNPASAGHALDAALALEPDNIPAITTAARLDFAAGKMEIFAACLQRLRALLPAAPALDFDDRVELAIVLARAKADDLLRAQMELCLRQADLPGLRRLRPDALFVFLSLARQLDLLDHRPGLWAMANPLLPAPLRAQLLWQFSNFDASPRQLTSNINLLRQALALDPDSVPVLSRLAWLLATTANDAVRNGPEAVTLASHARELGKNPDLAVTDTLACAEAAVGDFNHAVELELQAIAMAQVAHAANTPQVIAQLRARLALFQQNQPYRE